MASDGLTQAFVAADLAVLTVRQPHLQRNTWMAHVAYNSKDWTKEKRESFPLYPKLLPTSIHEFVRQVVELLPQDLESLFEPDDDVFANAFSRSGLAELTVARYGRWTAHASYDAADWAKRKTVGTTPTTDLPAAIRGLLAAIRRPPSSDGGFDSLFD